MRSYGGKTFPFLAPKVLPWALGVRKGTFWGVTSGRGAENTTLFQGGLKPRPTQAFEEKSSSRRYVAGRVNARAKEGDCKEKEHTFEVRNLILGRICCIVRQSKPQLSDKLKSKIKVSLRQGDGKGGAKCT